MIWGLIGTLMLLRMEIREGYRIRTFLFEVTQFVHLSLGLPKTLLLFIYNCKLYFVLQFFVF